MSLIQPVEHVEGGILEPEPSVTLGSEFLEKASGEFTLESDEATGEALGFGVRERDDAEMGQAWNLLCLSLTTEKNSQAAELHTGVELAGLEVIVAEENQAKVIGLLNGRAKVLGYIE